MSGTKLQALASLFMIRKTSLEVQTGHGRYAPFLGRCLQRHAVSSPRDWLLSSEAVVWTPIALHITSTSFHAWPKRGVSRRSGEATKYQPRGFQLIFCNVMSVNSTTTASCPYMKTYLYPLMLANAYRERCWVIAPLNFPDMAMFRPRDG
ncbi:uncharacterized protein BDZ83DRAFT_658328 [Colletotrichum acutatum]|uniref:Uncharacterized protein n=1 Tax=Glomerella acutata TaxID=27357 RepID=A0AAD8XAY9_GLOAC|nr:uncharacterized protein BDZ83DRAFT_658328 [Colletotrichum acutatum]KAK1703776.1 hypothetical protein BDZ83DRAFT_658328 [Colletotrichum acutatum]